MAETRRTIGVMAPASSIGEGVAEAVTALAQRRYGGRATLRIHPQCFLSRGHFAGPDDARAGALVELANDPEVDAVWFARGGYGSGRLIEAVLPRLGPVARAKVYLGYSDTAALTAAFYAHGIGRPAHGPMPQDMVREGGGGAVARALDYLMDEPAEALEPSLKPGMKAAAFNMAILSSLVGTPFMPDLAGHVLMLEEVAEYMYRIDRFLFHITSAAPLRRIAGLRLGRCSAIPENEPDFAMTEEPVARYWCDRAGIEYLGRADIGHDAANRIVPFGGI